MFRGRGIVLKRSPLRRRDKVDILPMLSTPLEESMLLERELLDTTLGQYGVESPFDLPHTFYPFSVFAMQVGQMSNATPRVCGSSLLMALHITDTSLVAAEAQLFSGTSVLGQRCVMHALDSFGKKSATTAVDTMQENSQLRLVASLLTLSEETVDVLLKKESGFQDPIPPHILRLLLASSASPRVLLLIVQRELKKYGQGELNYDVFSSCLKGLLANDSFFVSKHFQIMNSILLELLGGIGSSFDFLSVQWTPLLNKISRIYMRQSQGEALLQIHFKLLAVVPMIETKIPSSYLIHCIGSLLDVGIAKSTSDGIWEKMTELASLAIRLYGNRPDHLRSIWSVYLKGAVTLKPFSSRHKRILEAHHLRASLGHPMRLEKSSFFQVVRFLIGEIEHMSIEELNDAFQMFSLFLKEYPTVHFLWVIDSSIAIVSETWRTHDMEASVLVRNFTKFLQDEYFLSKHQGKVRLSENPSMRRLLEDFEIMEKSSFWWRCGCGTRIPACSKQCLTCMCRSNALWTCHTCGAEHMEADASESCVCGALSPRVLAAAQAEVVICASCGCIGSSLHECKSCSTPFPPLSPTRLCSCCGKSYGGNSLCCPNCYEVNEEKQFDLWRCDKCERFSPSTELICQRCLGRRKAGSIVVPFQAWVCGCGKRNHPCQLACESCSQKDSSTYTCNVCGTEVIISTLEELALGFVTLHLSCCGKCGNVHPRDHNVISSPFLPRHCHQCGGEYIGANLSSSKHCDFCHATLIYNEFRPFICGCCEFKSLQGGFQCKFCLAPRSDVVGSHVYVWKCLRELYDSISLEYKTCGGWNYSWSTCCTVCGEARVQRRHECRARYLPWICCECEHSNQPTNVLICPKCDNGVQPISDCPLCGLSHIGINCSTDPISLPGR